MQKHPHARSTFSGKIGFVLSAAGASVGLGNIWRFPYLAAKYGGGIFLLIYILLALTFGYTMIVAETSIGRMTGKSPVGAFQVFRQGRAGCRRAAGSTPSSRFSSCRITRSSAAGSSSIWRNTCWATATRSRATAISPRSFPTGCPTELCFIVFAAAHAADHLRGRATTASSACPSS